MRQLSSLRRLVVVGTYNSRYPHLPLVSEVLEIPIEFGIKIGVKIMKIRFLFLLGLVAGWPYISSAGGTSSMESCYIGISKGMKYADETGEFEYDLPSAASVLCYYE